MSRNDGRPAAPSAASYPLGREKDRCAEDASLGHRKTSAFSLSPGGIGIALSPTHQRDLTLARAGAGPRSPAQQRDLTLAWGADQLSVVRMPIPSQPRLRTEPAPSAGRPDPASPADQARPGLVRRTRPPQPRARTRPAPTPVADQSPPCPPPRTRATPPSSPGQAVPASPAAQASPTTSASQPALALLRRPAPPQTSPARPPPETSTTSRSSADKPRPPTARDHIRPTRMQTSPIPRSPEDQHHRPCRQADRPLNPTLCRIIATCR